MNYIIMFLTDGILGYFLQAFGYVLSLYAFTKKKIEFKSMFLVTLCLSVFMFLIRKITVISFGYHTILIMIFIILIAVVLLKIPTFIAAISILTTTIVILISEVLNLSVLKLIFGNDTIMTILQNNTTVHEQVMKSILGAPTNIVLVVVMFIFYRIRIRKKMV